MCALYAWSFAGKAGRRDVLVLAPEFVRTSDGSTKNENEITAAKRWLDRMGAWLSPLSVTIMGDDLNAAQPFIEQFLAEQLNFLFDRKPELHRYSYETIESHRQSGEIDSRSETHWDGKEYRTTTYESLDNVPVRGTDDALSVGSVAIRVSGQDRRNIYTNVLLPTTRLPRNPSLPSAPPGELGRRSLFFQELGTVACYRYDASRHGQLQFMVRQLELPNPGGLPHPDIQLSKSHGNCSLVLRSRTAVHGLFSFHIL